MGPVAMLSQAFGSTRRLRPTGWARYFDAAFLAVWLTFWTIGEVVGLVLIGAMVASSVSAALGRPLAMASRVAPTDGSVAFFLLFAVFWTTLWTVGGIAAGSHLLRRLAGEDVVDLTEGDLRLERRAGPFRSRRQIPRDTILRVRLQTPGHAVVVDTVRGMVTVSDLGTADDRTSLRDWLREALALTHGFDPRLERDTPPHDRDVEIHGGALVVSHPTRRTRTIGSWIMWGLTSLIALAWVDVLRRGFETVKTGEAAAFALTALVALAAIWIGGGRSEWTLAPNRMRVRFRVHSWMLRDAEFGDGSTIEIEHDRDSDNDDRYALVVTDRVRRRVLARAIHDPYELLALGEWLAGRTQFRFHRPASP